MNHAEEYVRGNVHTNGIENFWSLLKRTLSGTYVAVEPFHLDRYIDEQVFRFNNRGGKKSGKISDRDRFKLALSQIAGKRLTYAELTGKVEKRRSSVPWRGNAAQEAEARLAFRCSFACCSSRSISVLGTETICLTLALKFFHSGVSGVGFMRLSYPHSF